MAAPTKASLGVLNPAVLNRSNHTGLQAISTISGLQSALDSKLGISFSQGGWTPTIAVISNLDATPTGVFMFQRLGSQVHCWGSVTIDPTTSAAASFSVTLPVASNLGTSDDLRGLFATHSAERSGGIYGEPINDVAIFNLTATQTSARVFSFVFDYVVK